MTTQPDLIASELIRWMEVPRQPHVFALGNFARQVTFASQQARAFNLVWGLFKANRLTAGQRVAVVGAGLGGLTAAVAALAKECYVDVFEHASQPCPLQRGNDIRFIHPNILRWPEDGSEKANTDFPFLNWTAANVRGVIKQIDLQWNRRASKGNRLLRRFFNYRVNRLYVSPTKSGPQKPWLSANRVVDGVAAGDETSDGNTPGYVEFAYDCVILAVGFGEERSITGVPFLSYWENDSLHQETGRGQRSVLVSGCGDGGLIDALRLRLQNFDHAEFVREFQNIAGSRQLIEGLRKIESDLRPQAASADISLQLQAGYDALNVPTEVQEYFRRKKRTDTTVTLNSPLSGPLSFKASLLNRYATYLAMRYADLHYLSGRVIAERSDAGGFKIALERDDIGIREGKNFDLVIVRHGPENVIRRLVPEAAISEMQSWWETREDITTQPHWQLDDNDRPHRFFRGFETDTVPSPKDVLDLALATFDSAYREFRRDPDVQSVAVGEHDGKASFIVTLRTGSAPRQPIYYASVLVQYVTPAAVPATQPSPQVLVQGGRRLPIGVGIYNYDVQLRFDHAVPDTTGKATSPTEAAARPPDPYPSSIGTLGCFAKDQAGNAYLITASYVLALDNKGQIGDRIFVEGESPSNGDQPVARISANSLLATEDSESTIGIAAARLEPGVVPDHEAMPAPWMIERVGSAKFNDRVAKVGRTSGLTIGVVDSIGLHIRLGGSSIDGCFQISGVNGSRFTLPGDGGAVIVTEDGRAVGLLIASFLGSDDKSGSTIAAELGDSLKKLGLTLFTSGTSPNTNVKARKSQRTKRKLQ
ncbi:MAG TPA: hypothetical protein VJ875_16860 [Pyrinomonadaceae bacterium]|nr:hypothetical protein [Pyrinomonadaceae bacterium]